MGLGIRVEGTGGDDTEKVGPSSLLTSCSAVLFAESLAPGRQTEAAAAPSIAAAAASGCGAATGERPEMDAARFGLVGGNTTANHGERVE